MALLRFLDPMEWYMRKEDMRDIRTSRRGRDRRREGWTSYGPRANETPWEAVRPGARVPDSGAEEGEPNLLERHRQLRAEHAPLLEARVRGLLAGNTVVMETTRGTIRVLLVRFRSGAVIESWSESAGSTGHALMRMELEDLGDAISHLTSFLAWQVINLGPDAQPLG
jgi:hypothetical protein